MRVRALRDGSPVCAPVGAARRPSSHKSWRAAVEVLAAVACADIRREGCRMRAHCPIPSLNTWLFFFGGR